jgi:hypothetical protein
VNLMMWRLHADIDLIEDFYRTRASQPGADWYQADAKLKILGHGVECLAFAVGRGLVTLRPAQEARRRAAIAALRRLIAELEARDVGTARPVDQEVFRQLVGDTCHARHGLTFA